jgi:hypothetical protein
VKSSVVPEFGHWQPVAPLPGVFLHHALEEHLETLVNTLALAICLWMVSSCELQFCAQRLKKCFLEVACKYSIAIRRDGVRHAMEFDD